jgi:hypothetical protein
MLVGGDRAGGRDPKTATCASHTTNVSQRSINGGATPGVAAQREPSSVPKRAQRDAPAGSRKDTDLGGRARRSKQLTLKGGALKPDVSRPAKQHSAGPCCARSVRAVGPTGWKDLGQGAGVYYEPLALASTANAENLNLLQRLQVGQCQHLKAAPASQGN